MSGVNRAGLGRGAALVVGVSATHFNEEYMARLRPIMDRFSDEDLDRVSRGEGPRLYVLVWVLVAAALAGWLVLRRLSGGRSR